MAIKQIKRCVRLASFIFLLPHLAAAQVRPPLETLRIAYSAIGGSQSAVWIPYEAGIFRKHGLDVELVYVRGGGRAAQIVQSGEVPIGTFTGGAVVNSNLAGGDLVTIASEMNVLPFFLVVRPEIQRIDDLKGKRIGITGFGSATDFALLYAEQKWPVKRGRDFTVIQMGGHPEALAALRSRSIDGVVTNPEFTFQARKEGLKELVDMSASGLKFPTSSINTTRTFIRRNENAVRKFVRSFVEGMHFAKTQRAFSIDVFKKYLRNNDVHLLNNIYDLYVLRYHPKVPYPTREPVQTVLDQMAGKDLRAAAAKPEQFIEPRFVEELEKEGFIQQLWK
jgi:NitT/TauT family transport system substrate-binding protein